MHNIGFILIVSGYVMTYYHVQAGGHKLRVLTHERDLPVVVKLSCGAVAGSVAQTGRPSLLTVPVFW